jgi:hypothetical protein
MKKQKQGTEESAPGNLSGDEVVQQIFADHEAQYLLDDAQADAYNLNHVLHGTKLTNLHTRLMSEHLVAEASVKLFGMGSRVAKYVRTSDGRTYVVPVEEPKRPMEKQARFIGILPGEKLRKMLKKLVADEEAHVHELYSQGRPKAALWIKFCTWGLMFYAMGAFVSTNVVKMAKSVRKVFF